MFQVLIEEPVAFVIIAVVVFAYNIGNGLTSDLLRYPIAEGLAGRWREVRPGSIALAGLWVVYYVLGLPD